MPLAEEVGVGYFKSILAPKPPQQIFTEHVGKARSDALGDDYARDDDPAKRWGPDAGSDDLEENLDALQHRQPVGQLLAIHRLRNK